MTKLAPVVLFTLSKELGDWHGGIDNYIDILNREQCNEDKCKPLDNCADNTDDNTCHPTFNMSNHQNNATSENAGRLRQMFKDFRVADASSKPSKKRQTTSAPKRVQKSQKKARLQLPRIKKPVREAYASAACENKPTSARVLNLLARKNGSIRNSAKDADKSTSTSFIDAARVAGKWDEKKYDYVDKMECPRRTQPNLRKLLSVPAQNSLSLSNATFSLVRFKTIKIPVCGCRDLAETLLLMQMFPKTLVKVKAAIHFGCLDLFDMFELRGQVSCVDKKNRPNINNLQIQEIRLSISTLNARRFYYKRFLLFVEETVAGRFRHEAGEDCVRCAVCVQRLEVITSQKFSRDTFAKLFDIVQEHNAQKITTIKATQQLLNLIDEGDNSYQNKVILCFKSLNEQLPVDSFEAKEMELTTRLIQPLLQPLFEDGAKDRYLRWTNTQTEEFKKDEINCFYGCITLK
ncbi:hypothetical protein [Parasitella parasitica]|uniref:Uncharacterized protein n=1 Tax=Parasitella parasitica TaxID=35722 RepID=A0A0B7MYI7_9FUNG|nr:hypothetical protein [Parasitella parasitica]